ncbi:autophagy protein 5 (ATG5) [Novymonas esmeraldas]|uniref:Autophagy protein 5 (ATG5) n=1 Tax=Novymonas esmeraldas TaxID=1808958 RepID=A0AAW0EJ95_9TRYP
MRSPKDYIGGVPVVVRLADDDVLHPTDRPAPAAFVLPRTTVLLAMVRDLLQLFRPYTAALHPEMTQVWFSVRDTPLSWMQPAGAVKDYVNECVREERVAQLSATTSSSSPSSSPSAAAAALLQAHLSAMLSEPLELTFHVHSLTKGSALARNVPLYVPYDRLEDHIRMEVKQAHKAAYTVLYGSYAFYQRESESALQSAIGLALYRPFDAAAQEQLQSLQQQRYHDGGGGVGSGGRLASGSPRGGGGGHPALVTFTSPYLLAEYQQLLRGLLTPRPHVAYLIRLGFPFAYRGAACRSEAGHLQYDAHRVSAAPALTLRNVSAAAAAAAAEAVVLGPEQLPLGLLLWRLFRLPVLRWRMRQQPTPSAVAATAPVSETQRAYDQLLRTLARFYVDPPRSATELLDEQEPLLTGTPPEPPAWAAWEHTMSDAFTRGYHDSTGIVLEEGEEDSPPPRSSGSGRRVRFVVQGIQPPLSTPASFLEANLASSDRAIFVLVQV